MNAIVKRIAAGTVLAAAPVLVALGAATAGHADTTVNRHQRPVDQPADPAHAVPHPGLLRCDPGHLGASPAPDASRPAVMQNTRTDVRQERGAPA